MPDAKQRLLSIETNEVSLVDVPANLKTFLVVKSQEPPKMNTPAAAGTETSAPATPAQTPAAAPAAPVTKEGELSDARKAINALDDAVKAMMGCTDPEAKKKAIDGVRKAFADVSALHKAGKMTAEETGLLKEVFDPMALYEMLPPDGSSAGSSLPVTPPGDAAQPPVNAPPTDLTKALEASLQTALAPLSKQIDDLKKSSEEVAKRVSTIEEKSGVSKSLSDQGGGAPTTVEKKQGLWDGLPIGPRK